MLPECESLGQDYFCSDKMTAVTKLGSTPVCQTREELSMYSAPLSLV